MVTKSRQYKYHFVAITAHEYTLCILIKEHRRSCYTSSTFKLYKNKQMVSEPRYGTEYCIIFYFCANAESLWPNAPFHFPTISISFLLLSACCANFSALAIFKTSRRMWKVRSSEVVVSLDRLSLSGASWRPLRALSALRSAGPAGLSSGRRGSDRSCLNARKKLAATS